MTINPAAILWAIYFTGCSLFFYVFVEKDKAKATREDAAISGGIALLWPIVVVALLAIAGAEFLQRQNGKKK